MGLCIIEQRDTLLRGIKRHSVELDLSDPVRNAARVLDADFIARSAMAVTHSKSRSSPAECSSSTIPTVVG